MTNPVNRSVRFLFVIVFALFLGIGFSFVKFSTKASKEKTEKVAPSKDRTANNLTNKKLLKSVNLEFSPFNKTEILTLELISDQFSAPRLLDYHVLTNSLIVSSASKGKLELFSAKNRAEFLTNESLTSENLSQAKSLAVSRRPNAQFPSGEMFFGFDDGLLMRVSGESSEITQIKLPEEKSAIEGGLIFDSTGAFGGDLIAAAGAGKIWRVNKSGEAKLFLDLNTKLKALTAIPSNFERYGSLGGKLIVGAPEQQGIYVVDAVGQTVFHSLNLAAQDIDFVEPDENLFAISTESSKLWNVKAENLLDLTGDILISSAESKEVTVLHWNGVNFETSRLKTDDAINQIIFAPVSFSEDSVKSETPKPEISQEQRTNLPCGASISPSQQNLGAIGGSGTISVTARPVCGLFVTSDSDWLRLSSFKRSGTISFSAATNFTDQNRQATISVGNATAIVTQGANQPPQVSAGTDQTIALPNTASLSGTATDDGVGNPVTVSWSKVSGDEAVVFGTANSRNTTAIFSKEGVYVLRLTASDGYLTKTDDVQITVNPDPIPPPPDPSVIAPPIAATIATNPFESTKFLYSGANALQTGVAPGTIKETRVAVLRGRVVNKSGQPIARAKNSILDHSELGETMSRADGKFDMVVNGGGELNVKYEKVGFLPVQREEKVGWQDIEATEDVVMIPFDGNVSLIDLNSTAPIQMAQSGVITDSSGTRQSRLFFKQGTTATMRLPNNSTQSLTTMNVRSSEYTVGANGPATMPADLPPVSAYTYASEYSVDEAVAVGAVEVSFSQPVVQYNENFLNFPVGTIVPSGSFDKITGIWKPSANGRVVKIISVENGTANLDVNGKGVLATEAEYNDLGINLAERSQLAALYAVNQMLWRVPLIHFSAWDSNWGFGPPSDAGPPNGGNPSSGGGGGGNPGGSGGSNGSNECPGCIIGIEDQRLSEEIDVVGTPYFLRYDSTRPRGRVADYTARIPLSGAALPGTVKRIELKITIAGQIHEFVFPAQTNQITTFTWDGKDAYGRDMQGQQLAEIDISNVYDGVYQNTPFFGNFGNGIPITGSLTRQEINIHRREKLLLGSYNAPAESLGGWTLSEHHAYDPVGRKLYEGNGKQRSIQTVSNKIETFSGGLSGYLDGNVSQARFSRPYGVTVAPDGSVYVADSNNQRVRKISTSGEVTTFAGNGGGCNPANYPCGDGGSAANASFGGIGRVAVARDGSVYLSGGRNIWRVTTDGIFQRIAGTISAGFSGDGGSARDAQLSQASRAFPAPDGSVYVSDIVNQRIRRIDQNGVINTIAGTGVQGFSGDGGPATQATINNPGDLVIAPDGVVYFIDQDNYRIRRIGTDGIISTYAGTGVYGNSADGLPALQTNLIFRADNEIASGSMTLGADGALYFVTYLAFTAGGRVRRIGADGIVTGIAGNGQLGSLGDGGPALQAQTRLVAIGVAPDNSVYMVGGDRDFDESRIRKVSSPLPNFSGSQIALPSESGTELFQFDAQGRHLRTINTLTNATVSTFNYDSAGRLTSVVDGDGNTTTIERDAPGNPTGIRSPYNQLTTFTRDGNGYFATITNPNNETNQFAYSAGGLMTSKRDSRNNLNTFTYNALGQLVRDDDAISGFQILARTDQGANFSVTRNTSLNRQSTFQINNLANGERQRNTTFADGTREFFTERPNGTTTRTDANGTITNETIGGDPRWEFQAPLTKNTNVITPGGLTYSSSFNRAVSLSNPSNLLSLVSQTDTRIINGRTFTNIFTASNRTFVETSPQNRQTTTVIDTQNRPTRVQFADLNATEFVYDKRGRLSTTTVGAGANSRVSGLTYNAAGFPASSTNPLNQTTNFGYDSAGRVTQQTLPDTRAINFGYDANGNLTSLTPPSRPAHTFSYNAVNQVASYTAPNIGGNSTTAYEYNLDRDLTRITRPDALQINFAYDAPGKLQTLTSPNGNYIYSYNSATGLIADITAPGNAITAYQYDGFLPTRQTWTGTVAGFVSQTYDNDFRIATQSVNGGNTVNLTYDNDNLLTNVGGMTLTRNGNNGLPVGSVLGNVNDTTAYNNFAEPTNYNAKFNSTTVYDVNYVYDKLGRITQKTELIGGVTTVHAYGYDTTGRLTTVTLNGASQPFVVYAYDGNDNRTSINLSGNLTSATYDAQDRLTNYGATTYAYTLNGELRSKTNGANTTQYNYDVLGNLRSATLPNGTIIEYLIDGQNRRIGKKVNGILTQGFLYQDQLEPVAELDGANNVVSRFVYGTRSHAPDFMIKNGATYRIITDHLGSVRLVVDVANGNVAQRLDYDEFGGILSDTNPNFQPFGFAGGLYDSQTKLTRFGARDYDAEIGRWTAKDPILFGGGDSNLYGYAFNNPLNFIDPSGKGSLKDTIIGEILKKLGIETDPVGLTSDQAIRLLKNEITKKLNAKKLLEKERKKICGKTNPSLAEKKVADDLAKQIEAINKEITDLQNGINQIESITDAFNRGLNPFDPKSPIRRGAKSVNQFLRGGGIPAYID